MPTAATIEDVYMSLNETGLYAAAIYQDIFLGLDLPQYPNVWNTEGFK